MLEDLLRRAQRRGDLAHGLEPEAAARVLIAMFQGIVLQQTWDEGIDTSSCVGSFNGCYVVDKRREHGRRTDARDGSLALNRTLAARRLYESPLLADFVEKLRPAPFSGLFEPRPARQRIYNQLILLT
jgi:hypothetical protein